MSWPNVVSVLVDGGPTSEQHWLSIMWLSSMASGYPGQYIVIGDLEFGL